MKILRKALLAVKGMIKSAANKLLGAFPLFKDLVLAVANLTRSVNDLIRAYTQLAKMVIEDREAINDLYRHIDDLQQERLEALLLQESTANATPVRLSSKDPGRIDTSWAEPDKKKLVN